VGAARLEMAVRFWGLELAPGKAYKLMVPEDVELQINQVCLGPDSRVSDRARRCVCAFAETAGRSLRLWLRERQDSRTSMLKVKQLDDDGGDDGDEEMCVARLSVGAVDCQKLKLLFRCAYFADRQHIHPSGLADQRFVRRTQTRGAAPAHSGEEIVQFKAHGGNTVHITGQVLVRPWLSEDADASVRVTVSGATLPATPAASSKKRAAAADQKDSAAEQKQAKKQRLAEEASQREQMKAAKEAEAAAAAAAAQAKAEKKAAAEKLQRKKEKLAAEEEKQAAVKAVAEKKEKQKAAAAAKAKPEPFIQSRKFTGAKKGKRRSHCQPVTAPPAKVVCASREMRITHYDYSSLNLGGPRRGSPSARRRYRTLRRGRAARGAVLTHTLSKIRI
jgi:hypothetical protein